MGRTQLRGSQFKDNDLQPIDLASTNEAVDNYVPSYDEATGDFTWIPVAGGVSVLDDLTDVEFATGTPADNNVLTYDSGSGKWKAEAPQGGLTELSEDNTPQLGGDLDLNGKNIDFPSVSDISDVKDEDDMASDSATMLATQQSIKAYVDGLTGIDDFTIKRSGGNLKIADRIEQNIMLNFFNDAIRDSLTIFNLVNGFIDEYEDESGVDTGNSANEDYDSDNDLYKPLTDADLELDYMEYSTNELARADWVSSTPSGDPTIDENTVLTLHLNNNVTDVSTGGAGSPHEVTNNNVTFDSEIKKQGSHSGVFNGSTAYLTIPASSDWDLSGGSTSNDFTIDLWMKTSSQHTGCLLGCWASGNGWKILVSSNINQIGVYGATGAYDFTIPASGTYNDNNWHHIAWVRYSGTDNLYFDGVVCSKSGSISNVDSNLALDIGSDVTTHTQDFNGYIDELRITKGVAIWTTNFTPPIAEYSTEGEPGTLSVYSEGGTGAIVNQGSYSLKGIAEAIDSLNETITHTLGTGNHLDLTNYDSIKLDVYASEIGTNLQIQIHDSGGTTSTKDITIDTGDEDSWVTITWDISGISSANKDDIDSIIIKIIVSDTGSNDNTFYIDNVYAVGLTQNMTLISNSQTAESAPSDGRIIIFQEDVDAITLNTDIKAYLSRDGGSNWSQVTLADEGNYSGTKRVLSGIVDISGQPSDTNIEYKITTHNNKDQKIHGTAVSWD